MPVGKPTPDGDIVLGSRHASRAHGDLGLLASWNCPACGKQNDGQKVEQGCVHCGAGDQRQSTAGSTAPVEHAAASSTQRPVQPRRLENGGPRLMESIPPRVEQAAPVRILRLVEYLILPGQDANETLRRSLVGTMTFPWGTLTGTIVDSCDPRQEDLLSLARRQPGVWIGNPVAMNIDQHRLTPQYPTGVPVGVGDWRVTRGDSRMTPPNTGPDYSVTDADVALQIVHAGGLKLAYTLALGLQTIAEELAGNMEPDKFLTTDEALALARALMALIPDDWKGDAPPDTVEPPPPPAPAQEAEQARSRAAVARVRDASRPTPVYTEPKDRGATDADHA